MTGKRTGERDTGKIDDATRTEPGTREALEPAASIAQTWTERAVLGIVRDTGCSLNDLACPPYVRTSVDSGQVKSRTSTDSVRTSPLPGCLRSPTRPGLLIRTAPGTALAYQILMTCTSGMAS
jgi:hypothetical protein